jgi:hypothetical protein
MKHNKRSPPNKDESPKIRGVSKYYFGLLSNLQKQGRRDFALQLWML